MIGCISSRGNMQTAPAGIELRGKKYRLRLSEEYSVKLPIESPQRGNTCSMPTKENAPYNRHTQKTVISDLDNTRKPKRKTLRI